MNCASHVQPVSGAVASTTHATREIGLVFMLEKQHEGARPASELLVL